MTRFSRPKKFEWQEGDGAFSLSASQVPKTIAYINNQKEHHRKKTFQEEFLELLTNMASNTIRVTYSESQPSASRTTSLYCLSDPTDESVGYYHSSARADWGLP